MKGLNQCNFIGRLGQDPELKDTGTLKYTNFSIAVDESYKGKDGNFVNKAIWVACIAWGQLAEICGKYLKKGSKVFISGRLDISEYETEQGKKKSYKIKIDNLLMLDDKKNNEDSIGTVIHVTDNPAGIESDNIPF